MAGFESFIAGFAYGLTTVAVGQPLDTIKTRLQATGENSAIASFKDIYRNEGVKGLYRGGAPLVLGGGLMRSAQFGVYDNAILGIRKYTGGHTAPEDRFFGFLDYQVVCAGFIGGIGRGLVEGPFEYIKVRRQVHANWKLSEIFSGSGATIFRNSFLFSAFMIYVDISKQLVPDGALGPFLTGALCSNMAWLTIWPLDVAKSQLQSGNYQGKGFLVLVKDIVSSGRLYRGLLPGLTRSTIANGTSMVVYKKVEHALKELTGAEVLL